MAPQTCLDEGAEILQGRPLFFLTHVPCRALIADRLQPRSASPASPLASRRPAPLLAVLLLPHPAKCYVSVATSVEASCFSSSLQAGQFGTAAFISKDFQCPSDVSWVGGGHTPGKAPLLPDPRALSVLLADMVPDGRRRAPVLRVPAGPARPALPPREPRLLPLRYQKDSGTPRTWPRSPQNASRARRATRFLC